MLDHKPIVVEEFNGLFDRGQNDSCPPDHFIDCLNIDFEESSAKNRASFQSALSLSGIKRAKIYKRENENARVIVLTNTDGYGRFYDLAISSSTPFLTLFNVYDFDMTSLYNVAYISMKNSDGNPNHQVYAWNGTKYYKAGGAHPNSYIIGVATGSGSVSAGWHAFCVAFETETGFITRPYPTDPDIAPAVFFTGTQQVGLYAIPTTVPSPDGTASYYVKRHILATKSFSLGTPANIPEFFFLYTIEDMTTTTLNLDFLDGELIESADYLFDQYDAIPSGNFITSYKGRLVIGGLFENGSKLIYSKSGEPESFNQVTGYQIVDPNESGRLTKAIEYRGQLGITKGKSTYSTIDNGEEPVAWETPVIVDKGLGAYENGVAPILNSDGTSNDLLLVANQAGVIIFNGTYTKPELSWKIAQYWSDRINPDYANLIQIVNDPINKKLYVAFPLDSSTECNCILYGNYEKALSPSDIKWCPWILGAEASPLTIKSILIDVQQSGNPKLKIVTDSNIYEVNPDTEHGPTTVRFQTAYLTGSEQGAICHYGSLRWRLGGSGNLNVTMYGEDESDPIILPVLKMRLSPGGEYIQWTNKNNERVSLLVNLDADQILKLQRLTVYAKPLWLSRPVIEQPDTEQNLTVTEYVQVGFRSKRVSKSEFVTVSEYIAIRFYYM